MAQKNRNTPTTKTTRVSAEQKYNDFVADLFIKSIESGTAPWTKPWSTEDMVNMAPRNPETGTFYKGSNAALLFITEELNGYQDSRWMTFNQAKAAGGYVKAGEHGVPLRTFIFEREVPVLDDKGKPVLDKDGKQVTEIEELDPPIINTFTVFNVKQISFPPEHKYSQPLASDVTQEQVWKNLQRAEDLIKNTNAQIVFGTGSRAFYAPAKDYINLPKKEKFKTQEGFYSTALHELSHWTGHKARLDRPYNSRFGTPNYAREELVAEISSFMLCMNLGIGHNLENHASYVESWSKILKDDKKEIIEATKKANEAQKFITSFSQNNILAEDRIYLISTKDEQNFEKQLIDLGAFYDISENKFYITKETHDLSKFSEFLPDKQRKLKSSMSKLENLQTALNKAIKYLNDQTVKESLSTEEKQVYVGQLSDLIAHAETLKQLVELNQELDVKGIKADAVNSLDKRDEIGEQSEYRKMQERQEMNIPHKVNPAYADTYLVVPFYDKDEAKSLGAKWDRKIKHWYVPAGTDLNLFNKWTRADVAVNKYQREYELSEQKSRYLINSKTSAMEQSKQVLTTDKVKFRGR